MTFDKWWDSWNVCEKRLPFTYPVEKEIAKIIWAAAYEEGREDGYFKALVDNGL